MKQRTKITLILCLVVMMIFGMGTAAFAAQQLDMPTNLEWNPDGQDIKYGTMKWNLVENCEGTYEIVLYKDGVRYKSTHWSDVYDWDGTGCFVADHPEWFTESGSYYFTVQAVDDAGIYEDSEVAQSNVWEWIAPDASLKTPSNLIWKDNVPYWKGSPETNYYMVTYYKDGEECGCTWGRSDYDEDLDMYYEENPYLLEIMDREGPGVYTFSVMAISKDLTTWKNSADSMQGEKNNVTEIAANVTTQTNTLVESLYDGASAQDVRDELVYTVDSDKLAVSMVTTPEVLDNIEFMESCYEEEMGISVSVDVTSDVQMDGVPEDISIIGAALNAEAANSNVSLNVTKPDREYVIDPMAYKNIVFVDMNLTNVELNPDGSLKVPVYITMPVPENITVPQNFRILHYKYSSDEYELLHPLLSDDNKYASFALTHFSPFAFVEAVEEEIETIAMHRLYNPNSGEHFYTGSIEERDNLVRAGWQYEGVAWNAPTQTGDPVYRLFNPNNGDHHYTMSAEERDNLVAVGWRYEGVCWNSASPENLPLYRLYNPNADCGSHHYTGSTEERDFLVSLGWHFEGIGWFGIR